MAKIFQLPIYKGTVLDTYGKTITRTGTTSLKKTSKGWAFIGDNSNYFSVANAFDNMQSGTVEVWAKFNENKSAFQMILSDNANGLVLTRDSSLKLRGYIRNSSLTSTTTLLEGVWYHLVMNWNISANVRSIYINGVVEVTGSISLDTSTYSPRYIGIKGAGEGMYGDIAKLDVYDTSLTQQEINKLYADFLASKPISKPKRGFLVNKPNDLKNEVDKIVSTNTVTNSTFTTWTGSTPNSVPSGWSVTGTDADDYFEEATDGGARVVKASSSSVFLYQLNKMNTGKKYKITLQTVVNSGTLYVEETTGGSVVATITSSGTTTVTYTATNNTGIRFGRTAGAADIIVRSIAIQELSGLVAAYNMKPNGLTLTDISGNGNNGTVSGGVVSTKDGCLFNGVNGKISLPSTSGLNIISNTITVSARIKCNSLATIQYIYVNGWADKLEVYINTNGKIGFALHNGTSVNILNGNYILTNGNIYNITCVYDGINKYIYVNGVLDNSVAESGNIRTYSNQFNIGVGQNSTVFSSLGIEDLKVYNRALSLQEIKDYHNSFAKQPYLVEDFSDAPADGTSIVPREWQKISGAYKIGEISIGTGEMITVPANNSTFTSGSTSWTGSGNHSASIENNELKVVASGASNGSGNACTLLYSNINTQTNGKKYKWSFQARALSGTPTLRARTPFEWGSGNYREFVLSTTMQTFSIEATRLTDENAYFGLLQAGTFYIDNVSMTEIAPLPTLTKGSKYLECVTAGVLAIPSTQAFGTIEFDFYKGADINISSFYVIANTNLGANGYAFQINSTESIGLYKTGLYTLALTANSYITINTWYRLKITRSTAGVFTVLIKGGAFVPTAGRNGWTLISVAGGSGSNPTSADLAVTSANYFSLDFDAGDRISNILLRNGIIEE